MCETCTTEFEDLTEDQVTELADAMSVLFVGLPLVTNAPLVMGPEYYLEVTRHLIECGVRWCPDRSVKTYRPPTHDDPGGWQPIEGVAIEDPQDRIKRLAREQQDEYEAELRRRGLL